MNSLILCDTYYQIILAIQLARTIKKENSITLVVSDQSNHSSVVVERIRSINLFERVLFVETKRKKNAFLNLLLRLKEFSTALFGGSYLNKEAEKTFDDFYCCGASPLAHALFSVVYKKNNNIKVYFFEEGLLSYQSEIELSTRIRTLYFLRKMTKRKNLISSAEGFFCFYPEAYYGKLKAYRIPLVKQNDSVCSDLKRVFYIGDEQKYNEKYIFFTSVYDFEGGGKIGEYDLALKIRELVGNENLLIKKHPRDSRSVYEDAGFRVDSNSNYPWEVIQLTHDFENKILLTATSGSVLGGNFFCEHPLKTCYLYELCNFTDNKAAQITKKRIEEVFSNDVMAKILWYVKIGRTIEDILDYE